ncbi:hypothetical protein GCM10010331_55720 [Streptomyces xanthochromogenes]|nr:hypothetical protein GCM10010331_55720 [Streptomyces xanthochromogenes]
MVIPLGMCGAGPVQALVPRSERAVHTEAQFARHSAQLAHSTGLSNRRHSHPAAPVAPVHDAKTLARTPIVDEG